MAARDPGDGELSTDLTRPSWALRDAAHARPPGVEEDQEIWLLSYSDLVTLLFSVFVMLLAITALKDQLPKAPLLEPPPAAALDEPSPESQLPVQSPPPPAAPVLRQGEVAVPAPELLAQRWRARLLALGLPPGVVIEVGPGRVGIIIGDTILFALAQAELSEEGRAVLARLAPVLRAMPGEIAVEGHTDDIPIASTRFPSNWELSAARAAGVVRALIALGVPAPRLSAVGYADIRPRVPNQDAAARARNRRVTLSVRIEDAEGTE